MLGFHGPLPDYLASRGILRHHLSLSHEKGLACAMVVLEA
jgi:phosphopantetheinyl transferase (holo-ACP synthase)